MAEETEFYELEALERYFGGVDNVTRLIERCPKCGCKFVLNHRSDSVNLWVYETARCLNCDHGGRKVIHRMN